MLVLWKRMFLALSPDYLDALPLLLGVNQGLAYLSDLLLQNNDIPADLDNMTDTDCIHALFRKLGNLLEYFYILIRIQAILASLACWF